jgi:hypothetical protein
MKIRWIALLGALLLVLAACAGTTGAAPVQENGAASDGIGVHGAWTVDVINPDGTLDQHYEFHNELTAWGEETLAHLLNGGSAGEWEISAEEAGYATDPGHLAPCDDLDEISTNTSACVMTEEDSGTRSLTVAMASPGVLELSGSFVADRDGSISYVRTAVQVCDPLVDCYGDPIIVYADFTGTPVSQASGADYSIAQGQQVQITVDISFGTLP